ncbi:MAG: superoxide dismutase [Prevotellaceae bacterium]|jgi:Fe-Mn family superoxide dismutase|nr:superoxide dismutase [Prevotellaceae bacterium]
MIFELPILRFEKDALEPYISAHTIEFHYNKYFRYYVNKVNILLDEFQLTTLSLEAIMKRYAKRRGILFYSVAQVWNHSFYFEQLSPTPKTMPEGNLLSAINKSFDSFTEFKHKFDKAVISFCGSGNTWLSQKEDETLIITQETNAGNPFTKNYKPLLMCDVWEHAYYFDYPCRKADYVYNFWNILDWDVIEKRFDSKKLSVERFNAQI